jgi:hypothetical protein
MRGRRESVKDEVVGEEGTAGAMRSFQVGVSAWGSVFCRDRGLKDAPRIPSYIDSLLGLLIGEL